MKKINFLNVIKRKTRNTRKSVEKTFTKAKAIKRIKPFENALTEAHKIHYSRYIASWLRIYVKSHDITSIEAIYDENFIDWLINTGITEDEAWTIREMAVCGKMELEADASNFSKNHILNIDYIVEES